MDLFGITTDMVSENKQYWNRELGMCWQKLVTTIFENFCEDFIPAQKFGTDEPADCFIGKDAIDSKYRMGSGDSGTIKKWKSYADDLSQLGYTPVLLLLRKDNLSTPINACIKAGWKVFIAEETFKYIYQKTNFELKTWLESHIQLQTFYLNNKSS